MSPRPFPNELAPFSEDFKRLQAGGFADWRLSIDGMVHQPASLSIADLMSYPSRSQISEIACEEASRCFSVWINPSLVSMVGNKSR
ncbi:MAG: molybdopterin-dependent oxidoreductase [Terriglobales bacterium]